MKINKTIIQIRIEVMDMIKATIKIQIRIEVMDMIKATI